VVTLPTDLFRHEVFNTQSPPEDQAIIEIVDDVFLARVLAQTTQQGIGQPSVRRMSALTAPRSSVSKAWP